MAIRLAELAVRHGCDLHGDPDTEVSSVGSLQEAVSGEISFLSNPAYRAHLATTGASAVILATDVVADCPVACLVAPDPYAVFAAIAAELHPPPPLKPGLHATAQAGADCSIADSAQISAGVVLGSNVQIGERVYIGPNCVLGDNVVLGNDCRLEASVTFYSDVRVGERCILHSGVVVGADGFGNAQTSSGWLKVPQVGGVVLGDDVELGANTTVDRGAIGDTVLGNGVRIDNLVQIGHNVVIGDHTAMASQSGISGSTIIGARCMIAGKTGVAGHLSIADDVFLLGNSSITKDISAPGGAYSSVFPAEEASKWRRLAARFKRLDIMAKKIKELESKLKKLDK